MKLTVKVYSIPGKDPNVWDVENESPEDLYLLLRLKLLQMKSFSNVFSHMKTKKQSVDTLIWIDYQSTKTNTSIRSFFRDNIFLNFYNALQTNEVDFAFDITVAYSFPINVFSWFKDDLLSNPPNQVMITSSRKDNVITFMTEHGSSVKVCPIIKVLPTTVNNKTKKMTINQVNQLAPFIDFQDENVVREFLNDEPWSLVIVSAHAHYSLLNTKDVLKYFENTAELCNDAGWSKHLTSRELFDAITRTNTVDRQFTADVQKLTKWLKTQTFPCLESAFNYLCTIQPGFDHLNNETTHHDAVIGRSVSDPIIFAACLLCGIKWSIMKELWPQGIFPNDAIGHGTIDYLLGNEVLVAMARRSGSKRSRECDDDSEEEDKVEEEDDDNESGNVLRLKDKPNAATFENRLGTILGQAMDSTLDGAFDNASSTQRDNRWCVLSTGQRYYYFLVSTGGQKDTKKTFRLKFLNRYDFAFFNDMNSNTAAQTTDVLKKDGFLNVVAAFITCMLPSLSVQERKDHIIEKALNSKV